MEFNKYFDLFTKFVNGSVDINGIILTPEKGVNDDIVFKMDNAQDISYTRESLKIELNVVFHSFHNIVGHDDYYVFDIDCDGVYFNEELKEDVITRLSSVVELNFYDSGGDISTLQVNFETFKIIVYENILNIINYVTVNKCYDENGKKCELEIGKKMYNDFIDDDKYAESDMNYSIIDDCFGGDKYPNVYIHETTVLFVTTKFI